MHSRPAKSGGTARIILALIFFCVFWGGVDHQRITSSLTTVFSITNPDEDDPEAPVFPFHKIKHPLKTLWNFAESPSGKSYLHLRTAAANLPIIPIMFNTALARAPPCMPDLPTVYDGVIPERGRRSLISSRDNRSHSPS